MTNRDVLAEVARWATRTTPADGDPLAGWGPLLDAAGRHQLLGALGAALTARGWGPLPAALDPDGHMPLTIVHDAYAQNARRQGDLLVHLDMALGALAAAGVDCVPIKGAHWLLERWLDDPPARYIVDADIVVRPDRAGAAVVALMDAGYRPMSPRADADLADHQLTPLVHADLGGSLELHLAPLRGRRPIVTSDELFARARPVPDASYRLPAVDDAAALLVAHATLHDRSMHLGQLPLRAVVDAATLRRSGIDIDWEAVRQRFHGHGAAAHLAIEAFFATARELTGEPLPRAAASGRMWFAAASAGLEHPRGLGWWRETMCLPQALRRARMELLHGAYTRRQIASARLRHIAAGVRNRTTGRTGCHSADGGAPPPAHRSHAAPLR